MLQNIVDLSGAEEAPKSDEPKEDDTDDDGGDDEGGDDGGDGGERKKLEGDASGLKSALDKERKARKQLEKEARELRQFKEDQEGASKSETEKAKAAEVKANAKAERLAARLRQQAVDMAITKAATKLKFKDVDDALAQVTRDIEAWVDQDDEDPSEIEVDEGAVEKAVKALADRKKYLLQSEGEELPSGSKFGGSRKSDEEMTEQALREKYPSLRRATTST